jgi:hypothetical protein
MSQLSELHELIRAAGLPVSGLSHSGNSVIPEWAGEPTPAQRAEFNAMIASADLRKRRPKDIASLAGEINALPAGDFRKLQCATMAYLLASEPRLARRAGIALDGDEIA